jgi:hypothetical protein
MAASKAGTVKYGASYGLDSLHRRDQGCKESFCRSFAMSSLVMPPSIQNAATSERGVVN